MNLYILYVGRYELPDGTASAQRVIGIAKGLRFLGCKVEFLNPKKNTLIEENEKEYYGFKCYEYQMEKEYDSMFSGKTVLKHIRLKKPDIVILYNHPAIPLLRIIGFCHRNGIKCIMDATEWYVASGKNAIYRIIKTMDTFLRMRVLNKQTDGIIAISRYLYDYYKCKVDTVLIPPTIDIEDKKWKYIAEKSNNCTFIYAGSASAQKESLDKIIKSFEEIENADLRLVIV